MTDCAQSLSGQLNKKHKQGKISTNIIISVNNISNYLLLVAQQFSFSIMWVAGNDK